MFNAAGTGCLLGIIISGLMLILVVFGQIAAGKHRKAMSRVDLDALTEGDRTLWTSYDAKLLKNLPLSPDEFTRVQSWPARKR
jgi:hypothetical protein